MLSLLAATLAELGDTPEAIAATLAEQGHKGVRENSSCCPIAVYLTGLGWEWVDVGHLDVHAWSDLGEEHVEPSAAVDAFISRFDLGEWPELVDEPEVADV